MDTSERPKPSATQHACPCWCFECLSNVGPEGAFWHRSEPIKIDVYGEHEGGVPVPLAVRAEYLDKLPEDQHCGHGVPNLEAPVVRLEVDADAVGLSLTPAGARQLAASLVATADLIETAPSATAEPVAG